MAEVTIVETADAGIPPVEEVAEATVEQTEALAEAVVEVAEIEAARDVEIAEIQAEVASEAIEASEEVATDGVEEWRQSIETRLAASEARETEILSTLEALTQPPPNLPESLESPEAMQENQEVPEPEPVKKRPHHRLI